MSSTLIQITSGNDNIQGRRPTMEDAHTDIVDLASVLEGAFHPPPIDPAGGVMAVPSPLSFFAVYDGHAGSTAAIAASKEIFRLLGLRSDIIYGANPEVVSRGLIDLFEGWDRTFLEAARETGVTDGCAATSVFIRGDELYCANVGDSRCILCRNGIEVPLSIDHKPNRISERDRIIHAGGRVHSTKMRISEVAELDLGPERVWPGGLALSRALGDLNFKALDELGPKFNIRRELVVATPEVHYTKIQPDIDEFIVVACDGLWDVMSSQTVCDFVRSQRAIVAAEIYAKYEGFSFNTGSVLSDKCGEDVAAHTEHSMSGRIGHDCTPGASGNGNISTIGRGCMSDQQLEKADNEVALLLAKKLVQEAFVRNSQDNISAIVVLLRGPTTPRRSQEWLNIVTDFETLVDTLPKGEKSCEEGTIDLRLLAAAQICIPNTRIDRDRVKTRIREVYPCVEEADIMMAVKPLLPEELVPLRVYDNPTDPSLQANFPLEPPNPPPIEDDCESWGIIAFPFSMYGF